MQLSVKDVDEEIFREFKSEAVREGLKVGKALTLAMLIWIKKGRKKSLLNIKSVSWGYRNISQDVDEVLYQGL